MALVFEARKKSRASRRSRQIPPPEAGRKVTDERWVHVAVWLLVGFRWAVPRGIFPRASCGKLWRRSTLAPVPTSTLQALECASFSQGEDVGVRYVTYVAVVAGLLFVAVNGGNPRTGRVNLSPTHRTALDPLFEVGWQPPARLHRLRNRQQHAELLSDAQAP